MSLKSVELLPEINFALRFMPLYQISSQRAHPRLPASDRFTPSLTFSVTALLLTSLQCPVGMIMFSDATGNKRFNRRATSFTALKLFSLFFVPYSW